MKKLLAMLCLASVAACTPQQLATFERTTGVDVSADDEAALSALPDLPMRLDATRSIEVDGSITEFVPSGPCGEWYATAMSVGWPSSQWYRLSRIMYRESRCQPSARNRFAGASGLLQIMPMWADDCGGSRSSLFEPAFNLACGLHILQVQGWGAWAVR